MFEYDKQFTADKLLPEYRHIYEFELQRKDAFGNKQSLAIAIITLVIGAMTVMATSLPETSSICQLLLYIVMCATYLCLGVSIVYLFLASRPRDYSYVASIAKIDETIRSMHQRKLSPDDMASEFNKFLTNRYCEAASCNRILNIRRSKLFVRMLSWLCLGVVFLFIGIGVFAACSITASKPVAKTQIVNGRIQVDPNGPVPVMIMNKGDKVMSDGAEPKEKEPEPIKWPENDKIKENEERPSVETREEK